METMAAVVGRRVDALADDRDVGMRRRRAVTPAEKRSTASADPAGALSVAFAHDDQPKARISAWSRPTALFSASSEQAVRTNQFGQALRLMRRRHLAAAAHFDSLRLPRQPRRPDPASPPPMMWMS